MMAGSVHMRVQLPIMQMVSLIDNQGLDMFQDHAFSQLCRNKLSSMGINLRY